MPCWLSRFGCRSSILQVAVVGVAVSELSELPGIVAKSSRVFYRGDTALECVRNDLI